MTGSHSPGAAGAARTALRLAGLLVLYFLAGKLGLTFAFVNASASAIWPPSGIALGGLLVVGLHAWPAVFAGAFAVNLSTTGEVLGSLAIAAGNTFEAVIGAALVTRLAGGRRVFERGQDALKFALIAFCSTMVSATIGVTTLALGGRAPGADLASVWITWWLGDVAGALVVGPLLVLWTAGHPRVDLRAWAPLLLAVLVATGVVFTWAPLNRYPLVFLCVPPLIWTAFRLGPREVATSIGIVGFIATWATLRGAGPLVARAENESLLVVQAFLVTLAIMIQPVAALVGEQRRAATSRRRSEELLQTVLDRIPVMITLYEPDTRVLRLNREFERTLGWTTEEAREIDLMAACYPDPAYREEVRRFMESLAPGWRDLEMTARDGRVVETSWSNVQLWNDVRVGVGLDVRERRRAERERDALMAGEREARGEAEASNRAKDEFLAMLGHELRNPLGAIGSAVRVLALLAAPGDPGQRPRDVIERQVEHLSRLVDDLLDAARVSSGQVMLVRRPCDLGALARQVVGTFRSARRLDRHQVAVEAAPAWVDADPVRLEQVIANLLDNALKYSPAGERVRVAVHADGDDAVLTVADTGAGIAADLKPRIFDLFVQGARGTDRGPGGLGIGLTLVKRLVELHGGAVEVGSDGPGRGATFTVRLPRVAAPPEPTAGQRPAGGQRLRILIVEDNADARDMLSAALRLQGHEVHVAGDGPTAVTAALKLAPDAALVDIGLPGFDGYEVARRIRAATARPPTRLVALTGYGQPEDRRRTRDAGFDDHLVKPVDPARVAEALSGGSRRGD